MKKLFVILLSIALLAMPLSLAEEENTAQQDAAVEVQHVTDELMSLTYDLPADWIVMSPETVSALIAAMAENEETAALFSSDVLAQMEATVESGISMSMSADTLSNVTIVSSLGTGLTTQLIFESREVFMASYAAMEEQGLTLKNEGELVTVGEREYLYVSAEMLGQTMDVYIFAQNDMVYTISFTSCTPEMIELMLNSLAVVEIPEEDAADATNEADAADATDEADEADATNE